MTGWRLGIHYLPCIYVALWPNHCSFGFTMGNNTGDDHGDSRIHFHFEPRSGDRVLSYRPLPPHLHVRIASNRFA